MPSAVVTVWRGTSSFLILFILFVVALEFNEPDRINVAEGIFMVYSLGFTLEKIAAMQEHGIKGTYAFNTGGSLGTHGRA